MLYLETVSRANEREAAEPVKFLIQLQDRFLEVIEEVAAEMMMAASRYVPMVVRGYQTGRHGLVRPDGIHPRVLREGRRGQVWRMARLSALYPEDTVEWLDRLGNEAGGFNRSHTVLLLLLDWFSASPFAEICGLDGKKKFEWDGRLEDSPPLGSRIKTSFTLQKRVLKVIAGLAGRDGSTEQQYIRKVLASYAVGEERAKRPAMGAVARLAAGRAGQEYDMESLGFYFSPPLIDCVDVIGDRAGGFNRSHTILFLLLDWLRINPFDDILLGPSNQ
jgi:hypothetical protein